jgi:hypothetical protein
MFYVRFRYGDLFGLLAETGMSAVLMGMASFTLDRITRLQTEVCHLRRHIVIPHLCCCELI